MAGFMVGINPSYTGLNNVYENTYAAGEPQGSKEAGDSVQVSEEAKEEKGRFGKKDPGEKCETCEKRKYQDGSDENVSFKAATHIFPESAGSRVRAHEQEHVANAYSEAAQKDGEVLSVSVRIQTAVCPECGKNYVSGGTTSTKIKYPADPYAENQRKLKENAVRGRSIDYAARPLEEFEMERF